MSANKDDVPNDFYSLLLNSITQNLLDLSNSDENLNIKPEDSINDDENIKDAEKVKEAKIQAYKRIIAFKPGRSFIKKSIMIEAYNASTVSIADSLRDSCYCLNEPDFTDIPYNKEVWAQRYRERRFVLNIDSDPNVYLLNDDFIYIIKVMKSVLKQDYPKLTKLRLYLNEIAKICNKLDVIIPWTLPTGLNVNQSYLTDTTFQIKPFEYNKKSFTITHINEELDKRKQVRALMPNLIHSLDAASLCLLYSKYTATSKCMYTVHDCFAVPIPYVENLITILQSVYLDIYAEKGYLKSFDQCVLNNIKTTLGKEIEFIDNSEDLSQPKKIIYKEKTYPYPNVDLLFKDVSDFNVIFDALKNKKVIYVLV